MVEKMKKALLWCLVCLVCLVPCSGAALAAEADAAQDAAEPLVQSVAKSISQSIVTSIAGLLIFLGAFLVIYLLLHAVSLILNLVDRLPVVHTLNRVGGAVIGGVSCALVLTVLMGLLVNSGAMESSSFGGPVAQLLRRIAERIV